MPASDAILMMCPRPRAAIRLPASLVQENAAHIDFEMTFVTLNVLIDKSSRLQNPGHVHHDINPSVTRFDSLKKLRPTILVPNI